MNNTFFNWILRSYSRTRLPAKWLKRKYYKSGAMRFMKRFVKPGGLVFDVGANYGWKTELFLAVGARVVAIEPQSECLRVLKRKYGSNLSVFIEPFAAGAAETQSHIWKSDVRNQLSSMAPDWIFAVRNSGRFKHFEWSSKEDVNLVTLDSLVQKHGIPAFCKIDTEGYEFQALQGLSQPLPSLSIEYHVEFLEAAVKSVEYLARLGDYSFNYTIGEHHGFAGKNRLDSKAVINAIASRKVSSLQGDIYASLSLNPFSDFA